MAPALLEDFSARQYGARAFERNWKRNSGTMNVISKRKSPRE